MSRPTYSSNARTSSQWSYPSGSHHPNRPGWRSMSSQHRNQTEWILRMQDGVAILDHIPSQVNLIPPPTETYPGNNILSSRIELTSIQRIALVGDLIARRRYAQNNLQRLRAQLRDVERDEAIIDQTLSRFGNFTLHTPNTRVPTDRNINMMSYEGLLALQEEVGSVNLGLTDQIISERLKTRVVVCSSATAAEKTQEICSICQSEYKNQDRIGTLECRHEYHVDCIKQWLLFKNNCPICRRTGLQTV